VTVQYQTSDGSARAGIDYVATGGTLTFQSGQTSATITVPLSNNSSPGAPTETANLTLSSPGNARLGSAVTATVTVLEPFVIPLGGAAPFITGLDGAFVAAQGESFSGTVVSFTGPADPYFATILWGDGASTAGQVVADSGGFDVTDTHTYTLDGPYPVAVQVTDTNTGQVATLLSLGLVVALRQDDVLQVLTSYSLSYTRAALQSGTDAGGSFDLLDSGWVSYQLTRSLDGVDSTTNRTDTMALLFSLQGSGSDGSGGFSLGNYTAGATGSAADSVAQVNNDLNTYSNVTETDNSALNWQVTGNAQLGSYTWTQTTSGGGSSAGAGADGSGSFQTSSVISATSALEQSGNRVTGDFSRTLTLASSTTDKTTGNDVAEQEVSTGSQSAGSTWTESGNSVAGNF